MIEITLPYPPSVNHLYRNVGHRTILSRGGRDYIQKVGEVIAGLGISTLHGRLAVDVEVYPPDRKTRDMDNIQKALFDSLRKNEVIEDDGQIDRIAIRRMGATRGGAVIVRLEEI